MTQKEKQLLLKDLCTRLPYRVIVQVKDWTTLDTELKTGHIRLLQDGVLELKPYLRPMSSMPEEERKEFERLTIVYDTSDGSMLFSERGLDWLNAHHFDYRGLIEKGLAIAVTEKNNPYNE